MEPKFNTSFIPKKSLQADTVSSASSSGYVGRRHVRGPFFYFTLLLFVISVTLAFGVFGYTTIIDSRIKEKTENLQKKKQAFNDQEIQALMKLDLQIKNAKKLLAEHVSMSQLFNLLEEKTLKKIQYTELEYSNTDEVGPTMMITGKTDLYKHVAQQSNTYRDIRGIRNPLMRGLERQDDFLIEFSIESTIDELYTNYSTALNEGRITSSSNTVSAPTPVSTPNPASENAEGGDENNTEEPENI